MPEITEEILALAIQVARVLPVTMTVQAAVAVAAGGGEEEEEVAGGRGEAVLHIFLRGLPALTERVMAMVQ